MAIREIWSDLHYNLETDFQGSIKKVINVDAVITSIDNILRTRRGSRVMLPQFGSGISSLLFEPASKETVDKISDEIKEAINAWDSRVIINSIEFKTYPDRNIVDIKIFFAVRGYDEIFEYSNSIG